MTTSLRGYDNPGVEEISHALYVLYGNSKLSQNAHLAFVATIFGPYLRGRSQRSGTPSMSLAVG